MTTLVVAELYPWPAVDGYRQRLHHLIAGLAQAGPVDVIALQRPGHPDPGPPEVRGVRRVVTVPVGAEAGVRSWFAPWVRGDLPRRLHQLDWSAARGEIERLDLSDIDLVWYSHVDTWWPLHDLLGGHPAIVDFDNLENLSMRLRRRIPPRFAPGSSAAERARTTARWTVSRGFDLVDEKRWDRIQGRCAGEVDHVVVCSELDALRSGCPNAVVIPNGSDAVPDVVVDRTSLRRDRPTMLFVGALDYEPNTEAVEWFVRDVLPTILAHRPDAIVRIVGRGSGAVEWIVERPGAELVGPVDDMRPELRRADLSIVPIRVGAGTRLKVVEALANHLPLVTTTVGCEGIDVTDGVSALVADDAPHFADACLRALDDGALRQRLADAGHALFEERYTWRSIRGRVVDLARSTVR